MPLRRFTCLRPLLPLAMVAASSVLALAQQTVAVAGARHHRKRRRRTLMVKSRSGEDVKLHMTGDMRVVGIIKIALSDIKVGSFIGTTTVPGPDGGKTRSRCMCFRKTCAAPAKDRGPTI